MRITSLIENTSQGHLPVEHGLSLFVEMDKGLKIMFDMGQGKLFAQNAQELNLSIAEVDLAIVSHGHYDHGGGLHTFLNKNQKANVYVHRDAFLPHFSLRENGIRYIGLDENLRNNPRLVLCQDVMRIAPGLTLIGNVEGNMLPPAGNRLLYGPTMKEQDMFQHEQSLIIEEGNHSVLFAGCAHRGIVNIIEKAKKVLGHAPTHVFGGFHLVKSGLTEEKETDFLKQLAAKLLQYDCTYYTMHCTGLPAYEQLKKLMKERIGYLACGDRVSIKGLPNGNAVIRR